MRPILLSRNMGVVQDVWLPVVSFLNTDKSQVDLNWWFGWWFGIYPTSNHQSRPPMGHSSWVFPWKNIRTQVSFLISSGSSKSIRHIKASGNERWCLHPMGPPFCSWHREAKGNAKASPAFWARKRRAKQPHVRLESHDGKPAFWAQSHFGVQSKKK